jgi:hypothetical protein
MANASALADQQRGDELVRRIGEDEVGRVKADGVPEAWKKRESESAREQGDYS